MRIRNLMTFLVACAASFGAAAAPSIAVIEDAPWSPGDASREGAAEFEVLVRLAQLQQQQPLVGFVGLGDRRGIFQEGTRRGLEFAVRQGVPVVRLSRGASRAVPVDTDIFIDGGSMSPAAAAALLARCLERFGPLPALASTRSLSPQNADELRSKLRLYQAEFTARQSAMIAMN